MHRTIPTITVSEAAERLGLDTRMIKRLIEQGQLPALRLGGAERTYFRIRAEDLDTLFKPQNPPKDISA